MSKQMWIIAGPNGAGKSTFANEFFHNPEFSDVEKLNADDYAKQLRSLMPDEPQASIDINAAIETDRRVEACIKAGRSFSIETVLSTDKYRDDVTIAKKNGFRISLIYISLFPPELSPLRVSERVAKGGHNVETSKAIERYHKSHEQLRWFATHVDFVMVFDNSSCKGEPILLAWRSGQRPLVYMAHGINETVDRALNGIDMIIS